MRNEADINDVYHQLEANAPLSFRDQCAIAAMQSIVSIENMFENFAEDSIARSAFNQADAMEAERQKRSQK